MDKHKCPSILNLDLQSRLNVIASRGFLALGKICVGLFIFPQLETAQRHVSIEGTQLLMICAESKSLNVFSSRDFEIASLYQVFGVLFVLLTSLVVRTQVVRKLRHLHVYVLCFNFALVCFLL